MLLQPHADEKQSSTPVAPVKALELSDSYQEHSFIDARDAEGEWRVGYVLNRNEKTRYFKIRFDGWQAKWDEVSHFRLSSFSSAVPNCATSAP